ncbi:MAG: hypothetical protein ACRDHF_09645 [Tepidiformaceae bacterium]
MFGYWQARRLALSIGAAILVLGVVATMLSARSTPTVEGAPPAKPAALNNFEVVFADSGLASAALLQHARAVCPDGSGVISGGYGLGTSGIDAYVVIDNHPAPAFTVVAPPDPPVTTNNSWAVSIKRTDGFAGVWSIVAYAVCVEVVEP